MINIIKEARLKKGYNMSQFAKLIGYTRQSISQLEKGQFKPTYKSLILISNTLDIDIKTLVYYFAFNEK